MIALFFVSVRSYADDFVFDDKILKMNGVNYSVGLNSDDAFYEPGNYTLNIYLNNKKIMQEEVSVIIKNKKLVPLIDNSIFDAIPLKTKNCQGIKKREHPFEINECIPEASVKLQLSKLDLYLSIPQSLMAYVPDDYIPESEFDPGNTVFFTNYTLNQYYSRYSMNQGGDSSSSSMYLGLTSGLNLGMWQFRQQSNLSKNPDKSLAWKATNLYVKRPLSKIKSELFLGQLNSDGVSAFQYNGLSLKNDKQMIPASLRGYSPVIRGQARTNARVSIFQGKNKIYETTVPAGRFELNNVFPSLSQEQLRVIISESDGSQSSYLVPISSMSESLRQGRFNYNLNIGTLPDYANSSLFGQMSAGYGFNNVLTGNGGFLFGPNYHSTNVGMVYMTQIGALGSGLIFSDASLKNNRKQQGWMMNVNYNKVITNTETNIGIAGYKYSSRGYRDFQDVVAMNNDHNPLSSFDGGNYLQKNRLQLTLTQPMADYGTLSASLSSQHYYDGRSKDTSYQLGYSKGFAHGIVFTLLVSKQKQLRVIHYDHSYDSRERQDNNVTNDRTLSLSLSIPLSNSKYASYISTEYQNDKTMGTSLNTSVSGSLDSANRFNWSVGYQKQDSDTLLNANTSATLPFTDVSATVSKSNYAQQFSTTWSGSLVAHRGGITLGHTLSDTFGIIEAKHAQGAVVLNDKNVVVDRFGYAILPSLTPYSRNNISIEIPADKNENVDISDGSAMVVPYSGAAVKIKFKTLSGKAVMLQIKASNGDYLPFGTEIYNKEGKQMGFVGQGGNIYLRINDDKETFVAKVNDSQRCTVHFPPGKLTSSDPIIFINGICQ